MFRSKLFASFTFLPGLFLRPPVVLPPITNLTLAFLHVREVTAEFKHTHNVTLEF